MFLDTKPDVKLRNINMKPNVKLKDQYIDEDGYIDIRIKKIKKSNMKEKLSDKPKEKLSDKSKEKLSDKSKEKLSDKSKEKLSDTPKEKLSDKSKEKQSDKPKEKLSDTPKEKLSDKPKEKLRDKPKEKLSDKPKEKLSNKPKEKLSDKPKEKPTEKLSNKSKEKLSDTQKEKLSDKSKEKLSDAPKEKLSDTPKEKPSDNPKSKSKSNKQIKIKGQIIENLEQLENSELSDKEKAKLIYNQKKIDFCNTVKNHKNEIWCPPHNIELKDTKQNTWFTILESDTYYTQFNDNFIKKETKKDDDGSDDEKELIFSKKIILKLTRYQKIIVRRWMHAYIKMYNETLKYIRNEFKLNGKCTLSFHKMRKIMQNIKNEICKNSKIDDKIFYECHNKKKNNNTYIKIHYLDYAIKLACSNYKSALTNLRRGHIKKFRIRYWKYNKEKMIIDFEQADFVNGSIRDAVLGDIKGYYNGKAYDFTTVTKDSRLIFNRKLNEYILTVPEIVADEIIIDKKQDMSISDPGVRVYMTVLSENKVIKIGSGVSKRIEMYLEKINYINNNKDILKMRKRKLERKYYKKLEHLVDELHWKTINYLTSNYKKILIGNMSAKGIVSNENDFQLKKLTKQAVIILGYYKYRQRLEYKCECRGCYYECVNEWITSKTCSLCGNIKENLGGNKIYNCDVCGSIIDRDINPNRNMYIRSRYC